jgi:hypothetical protein
MYLYCEEDAIPRESACNLVDHLSNGRCRAAKVQAVHLIQGGAPRRRNEGNYTSIVRYVEIFKERYLLAMDEVDPLSDRREVAVRECKHLLVGFEPNAL